jgi:hypothetical protein
MVRAEICSTVEGSKSITLPCELPDQLAKKDKRETWFKLTESYVAVPHPRRNFDFFVRREPRHFIAGQKIPHDGGQAGIVANDQAAAASFADVVHGNPLHGLPVAVEAALDGEGVVVKAQDDIELRVQQEGSSGSASGEWTVGQRRETRAWSGN